MSIIKRMKISASDDRGEIIDIFSKEPKDHCTIVTLKKNSYISVRVFNEVN